MVLALVSATEIPNEATVVSNYGFNQHAKYSNLEKSKNCDGKAEKTKATPKPKTQFEKHEFD